MDARGVWRTGEQLGAGAMGVVYAATHRWLHTPAALKVLAGSPSPRALRRFREEMRAVAALDHPNVIDVYDIGEDWFVVERLGATLRTAAPQSWEHVRAHLGALLAALGHAHAHDVVHCDLKPDNVLLDALGQPVLADFGLALLRADRRDGAAGTPLYMAPEQFRGRDLGPPTDLYALGVVAWELVCGITPFVANAPSQLQQAHLGAELPALRAVMPIPEGLEAWLAVLLEKDPRARFPTAGHAAAALQSLGPAVGGADPLPARRAPTSTWFTGTWEADAPAEAPQAAPEGPTFAAPALPSDWHAPPPRSPHASLSLFGVRAPRWVAREAEASRIWSLIRATCADLRPRGLRVTGAPGVGASRLVQHLAGRAVESGAVVWRRLDEPADDRPAVIVCDDASPEQMAAAAKRLTSDNPVVVLLTGPAGSHAPLGFETLELAPLDDADQHALIASLAPFDPALVRRIVTLTGGNPQLAVQFVGDALSRGVVVPSEQGLAIDGPLDLPTEARAAWSRRLASAWDEVPLIERGSALVGALLGATVDEARWTEACALFGAPVPGVGVDRLVEIGLVQRRAERLRFAHEGLRRAIVEASPAELRRAAHDACAAVSTDTVERAGHLVDAGRPEAAAEALGPFGPGHTFHSPTLPVWDRVLTALAVGDHDPKRIYWRTWRAWMDQVEGRFAEAVAQASKAVEDAEGSGQAHLVPDALNTLGVSLRHLRRLPEAEAAFQRAWTLATASGLAAESVLAGRMLARTAMERGDTEGAAARARELVAFADGSGSDGRQAEARQELARILGPTAESRALLDFALAVYQRNGKRQQELSCRFEIASQDMHSGDLDRAISEYESLATAMEQMGGAEAAIARIAVASCWMERRDWPQLERALRLARGRFGPGTRAVLVANGHALGAVAAAAAEDWQRFDDEIAAVVPCPDLHVARALTVAGGLAEEAGETSRAARARRLSALSAVRPP